MFKNPTNHGLFGPWANELCAHLQKKLLKKLETMAFWAHGLTNVQPISKKQDYKNFWIWTIQIWSIMIFWVHGPMNVLVWRVLGNKFVRL